MLNLRRLFKRPQKFNETAASVWFGAAVPLIMAVSSMISYVVSWFNIAFLDWLFFSIAEAVAAFTVAGGWLFPVIGIILAGRSLKIDKQVAVASLALSSAELVFYVVVVSSIFLNSNTLID